AEGAADDGRDVFWGASAAGVAAGPPPTDPPMVDPPTMVGPPSGPPGLDDLPVVGAGALEGNVRDFEALPVADEPPATSEAGADADMESMAGSGGAMADSGIGGSMADDGGMSTAPGPADAGATPAGDDAFVAGIVPPPAEEISAEVPASPPSTPTPESAFAPPSGFTSQLLGALDSDEIDERDALPLEPEPSEVRQADQVTSEVMVQGVVCSRGHFNDPRSRFCSSCGISMVQNTQILTNGPRPPLGVMVFEDGSTFSLSTDYVVGRQPEVSELVQQGLALPLPVDDPERSISRAHAELRLVDWDVHLVNLSGTNGSFVWDEHAQQWIAIPEGQSVMLTPGMRVALGRRSAVFESSLVR
ncbi:MAG: FHA domain-containing protein, partial [Acidimicrobiales bacterium]|nr:FHA domain-containing protein [Acidimicrobiales bacterium]